MEKVVVLSCTNRPDSNTLKVSRIYKALCEEFGSSAEILDFCDLPRDIAFSEAFGEHSESFSQLVNRYIASTRRFVFVMPEYNGSFPGILKVFLDSIHPSLWTDKKACLVGVSDGRAGNLRGMEHLTGILSYLKVHVYHNKLPISRIAHQFDAGGGFNLGEQSAASRHQVEGFLKF